MVVIRGPGWVHDELQQRGLIPFIVEAKGAFNWRFLHALIDIIRHKHIDLVQLDLISSNIYCALAGLLTARPVIATFHGMVDVDPYERLRWLKFQLMNRGINRFV
ncbi:MAG: glycosyltransferase [Chromatiales bacterium]|nr:glycosyltransferase [Chromatiales bacterium]